MRRHRVRLGPASAAAAAVALCAAATPQQQPQFRAGVELVVVDVSVVDRDGRPVSDLRQADFSLTVDGRTRRLVSAEFVSLASLRSGEPVERPATRPASTITDGFTGNTQARPGRLFLLAVDQAHLRPTSAKGAAEAAGRFLDQLNANDQVGLIAFPDSGPSVSFTADRDRVKEAVKQVTGRAEMARTKFRLSTAEALASPSTGLSSRRLDSAWLSAVERECSPFASKADTSQFANCQLGLENEAKTVIDIERRATETTAGVLAELITRLGEIEGPKTVVLISEGLPAGPELDAAGPMRQLASLGRLAATARVNMYVLQLDQSFLDTFDASRRSSSASPGADADVQARGLEAVAGATRGAVLRVTAKADWAFSRVASETSAYYLLSFEPEAGDRDGKPHGIRVRVARNTVVVRSRAEFVAGGAAAAAKSADEEVRALLTSPLVIATLPLRLGAFVMRDPTTPAVRTLVAADIDAGVTGPGEVTLGLSITDMAGKVVGGYVRKETLQRFGVGEASCLKFSDAFLVSPGEYTLKLAVVDSRGRRGSAVHRVVATIPRAGNVETSDLLLIDPGGGGAEGGTPAVTSTIAGEAVGMYLEVYYPRGRPPKDVKVTVDVAAGGEGPAIFTMPAVVADRPDQSRFVATAIVAAPLLPPGTYTARALVVLDGRPVGRALRLFHVVSLAPVGGGAAARGAPRNLVAFGEGGSLVRPFKRSSVLGPDVVSYFLKRLEDSAGKPSGQAVLSAVDHAKTSQFDKLLADLAGANPDDLAVAFLRGLARFSKSELQPAVEEFRDALRISSEFLPAVFYLGACYAASGLDRDAAGAWQLALLTESDARIVYDVLADAYIRLRDSEQAEAIMKEAMAKWPDDDVFVPRLAAAIAIAGRDAEALSILGRYFERRPDDDQALFLAIRLLYEALAKGRPVRSSLEDRADLARYAKQYQGTQGANKEIVARWLKWAEGQAR